MINFITCFTLRILRNAKLQLFFEMAKYFYPLTIKYHYQIPVIKPHLLHI